MKYRLRVSVRWQRTARQSVVLALMLMMMASGLATAQKTRQPKTAAEYFKCGPSYSQKGDLNRVFALVSRFLNSHINSPSIRQMFFPLVPFSPIGQAQADVFSVDDPMYGQGSITRDTVGGLDWLDISVTANRSFNDISNQFGIGGQFPGFRHATSAEVLQFFTDAGIPFIVTTPFTVTPSSSNVPAVPNLMTMWGITGSLSFPDATLSQAIVADGPAPNVLYHSSLGYLPHLNVAYASTRGSSAGRDSSFPLVGHALVRPSMPIDLTCPLATQKKGCNIVSISPLVYSETPVTITLAQLQAEGGNASAACGIASITYQDSRSGNCPTLVVNRTFTVTDVCGNSTSCQQTIESGGGLFGPNQVTDLVVLDASYLASPFFPEPGPFISWEFFPRARVRNLGPAATQDILVKFDLMGSGGRGTYATISTLNPGQTLIVQPHIDPDGHSRMYVKPGNYTLRVTVDWNHRITETNEENNVFEVPVSLPDR